MNFVGRDSLPSRFHGSRSRVESRLHIPLGSDGSGLLHQRTHLSGSFGFGFQAVKLLLRHSLHFLLESSELVHGGFHGRFELFLCFFQGDLGFLRFVVAFELQGGPGSVSFDLEELH
uniref:Uncharacterized protein n=1 Tax=Cannabis sativa TaxID=3483 RepID=A0A803R3A8_CANSA